MTIKIKIITLVHARIVFWKQIKLKQIWLFIIYNSKWLQELVGGYIIIYLFYKRNCDLERILEFYTTFLVQDLPHASKFPNQATAR